MDKKYVNLQDRDIQAFLDVYHFQSARLIDLKYKHYENRLAGYRRLNLLRNWGYFHSTHESGFNGSRDKVVYHPTDKMIQELVKRNLAEPRRSRDLRLTGSPLYAKLHISSIILPISWPYQGSRDTKNEYEIPYNSILQGSVKDPSGKTYLVYFINNYTKLPIFQKILKEAGNFPVIVIYPSTPQNITPSKIEKFIQHYETEQPSLVELCFIPSHFPEYDTMNLASRMLAYSTTENISRYLQNNFQKVIQKPNRYNFGDLVVTESGTEYLVCNYLRRDLVSLNLLNRQLTHNEHRQTGHHALILTWQGLLPEVEEKLESYQPGRDFIKITPLTLSDFAEQQTPVHYAQVSQLAESAK